MDRRSPIALDGTLPELQPAQRALARIERAVRAGTCSTSLTPLYLHGPPGCGKSHLLGELLHRLGGEIGAVVLAGRDIARSLGFGQGHGETEERDLLERADLLALEDVPSVPAATSEALAVLLDARRRLRKATVAIGTIGPALMLRHGARLRSRLAAGLVLAVPALDHASRRCFLAERAVVESLRLEPGALDWLAEKTPGSFRQLLGAIERLRQNRTPGVLSLALVKSLLQEAKEPTTLEEIVREVGRFYRVRLPMLKGKSRERAALIPRQVSMYLARVLTGLSLEAIGAFFGGRDHATVLHACRKVEQSLELDPGLAGAVKTLRGSLG